jgi:hypothetical protein
LPRARAGPEKGTATFPLGNQAHVLEYEAWRTWRSRLVPRAAAGSEPTELVPALRPLGSHAPTFAAAFAATVARPTLNLLPAASKAACVLAARRRAGRAFAVAVALCLVAITLYGARVRAAEREAERVLMDLAPRVSRATSVRADLAQTAAALETLRAAARNRSGVLELLASLSVGLSDSVVIAAVSVEDSVTRITALAPGVPAALAEFERLPILRRPRLEGVVTRQTVLVAGVRRDWSRFAVRASLERSR